MTKEITVSATADLHGYLPKIHAATIIVIAGDIFPGERRPLRYRIRP